jgi:predicted outer membrane repeat protein
MPRSTIAAVLLLGLIAAVPGEAADAVVGPPCDELALDDALDTVQGSGGGMVTFNGGAVVIPIASLKWIYGTVALVGGGQVTLSGEDATPLFLVDTSGRLTLDGLTLRDGYNAIDHGGAIYNEGLLTIVRSTFRNNRTTAAYSGGAIVSYGRVEIADSLFEGNQGGGGGALYLRFAASASIRNTIFRNNATLSTTSGWGGALLTSDGPTATIEGGEMYENGALSGGAIYNTSGSSLVIMGASIHRNQALNGNGGAIYSAGLLTMTGGVIDENSSKFGGGLFLIGAGMQEARRTSPGPRSATTTRSNQEAGSTCLLHTGLA